MSKVHYLCASCVWDYRDRAGKFESPTRHACVKKLQRAVDLHLVERCCNCGEIADPVEATFLVVGDMECCVEH